MDKIEALLKNQKFTRSRGRLVFIKPVDKLNGRLPKNPAAIRERLRPSLADYSFIMTLAAKKVIEQLLLLLPRPIKSIRVLDLGCGFKPFQALFPGSQYLGVDISVNSYADIIADNQSLPFKDNLFDVVIMTEVLEHCDNEYAVISELRRVAKNKALIYLTMPFMFPLHGVPHDFNRFTKYKLNNLFKDDKIILLEASNNIFASVFIFINMVIRILFGSAPLLIPIYIVNNLLAMAAENLGRLYRDKTGFIAEYWRYALGAFPIGYSMIVRIKK